MSVPLNVLEVAPISNPELLWITQCACSASLTLVLWETFINLGDESRYIWPRSNGPYIKIKWIYLFARYFTIAVQIANINVIFTFARIAPVAARVCEDFYIYQGCSVEALLLAFDFVLLVRVHALYNQQYRYTLIGVAAILVELITMFVSGFIAIPRVPYNRDCLVMSTPSSVLYFVLGVGFSQCVILGMTYHKKLELNRLSQGERIPILWIVIRDGALAFSVMASLVILLLVYILFEKAMANLIYYWFSAVLSIATCRLILNMQRLSSATDGNCEATDGQFTTNFQHLDRDPDSIRLECVHHVYSGSDSI